MNPLEVYLLPFLKKKIPGAAGLIVETRNSEQNQDQDESSLAIEQCAMELIEAVHSRNVQGVAQAMKSAFDILESIPHSEVEPHSYESQNIKAGGEEEYG